MKKVKKIIVQIIIIIIFCVISFFIGKQIGLNTDTSTTTTTIEEIEVEYQTITKTLTGSGEISSANTERLDLSTTSYFETMCVEEGDIVEEGDNILKYTDGTYLTAPYYCIISSYSVPETGELATENNYIEIKDMQNLTITLSINENEITEISLEQEVEISLTADTSKTYTGTISKISSIGTYSTSGTTFQVVVSFENDETIKLGMSASCTITIEELEDVIAVPIEAVQIDGDRRYVIVVKDGETEEVDVETGASDDEYVEIKSGLEVGEKVQVTTTTKESTIRSESSEDEMSDFGEQRGNGGGGDMQMPDMDGGSQAPSMPNQ